MENMQDHPDMVLINAGNAGCTSVSCCRNMKGTCISKSQWHQPVRQIVELVFCIKKSAEIPLYFNTNFKKYMKYMFLYYFCILLPLRSKVSGTIIEFLDWRIASAINSKLCCWYPGHPTPPSAIMPSRSDWHFCFSKISD